MLEETKKEKVPFLFLCVLPLNQPPQAHVLGFSPLAAAEQPVRDGENEGGAREEEVLLGARGAQRKGEGESFRDIKRREYNIIICNCQYSLSVIPKA